MGHDYPRTVQYVTNFLKWLAPDATGRMLPEQSLRIYLHDDRLDVPFDKAELEDFEVAQERFQNTNYFYTLENRIRFRIFIALGREGLIPYVSISSELLQERGEWLKSVRTDLRLDNAFSAVLHRGLTVLFESISKTLASGLKLPEVEAEKETVDILRRFYDEHGHLSSPGVEAENLSYLKAAAVCAIIEKEDAKQKADIPRVRKAIDGEIYSIVARIRDDPFRDIKLPEAMHDYALRRGAAATSKTPIYVREIVETEEQSKLDVLLDRLDPRLRRRREGAWGALRSQNPDRLSQAANSMVELLDQVIGQACEGTDLATFLTTKYQTHQKTEWVTATRQWIGRTKDNLHSTKHHTDHQSEQLTKALLTTSESILLVLLE
jgi:hypothetical protein